MAHQKELITIKTEPLNYADQYESFLLFPLGKKLLKRQKYLNKNTKHL